MSRLMISTLFISLLVSAQVFAQEVGRHTVVCPLEQTNSKLTVYIEGTYPDGVADSARVIVSKNLDQAPYNQTLEEVSNALVGTAQFFYPGTRSQDLSKLKLDLGRSGKVEIISLREGMAHRFFLKSSMRYANYPTGTEVQCFYSFGTTRSPGMSGGN